MFNALKLYFSSKRAYKPTSLMIKYTFKIIKELKIDDENVEFEHMAFLLAWLNTIYANFYKEFMKAQTGMIFLLCQHFEKNGVSEDSTRTVLELRLKYQEEIFSKIKFYVGSPAFLSVMTEIATEFFLSYKDFAFDQEDVFSTMVTNSALFCSDMNS